MSSLFLVISDFFSFWNGCHKFRNYLARKNLWTCLSRNSRAASIICNSINFRGGNSYKNDSKFKQFFKYSEKMARYSRKVRPIKLSARKWMEQSKIIAKNCLENLQKKGNKRFLVLLILLLQNCWEKNLQDHNEWLQEELLFFDHLKVRAKKVEVSFRHPPFL